MPLDWLHSSVPLAGVASLVALYVATLLSPLWTVWRSRRGSPDDRYRLWPYCVQLALIVALLAVPGIDAGNLGIGHPARGWAAGFGLTAAFVAIVVVGTVRKYSIYAEVGAHAHRSTRERRQYSAFAVLGCTRDAFVFVVVPLFVGVGVWGLPLLWVGVGTALVYGLHHLPLGWIKVVEWALCAAGAVVVYLLSASVLAPVAVIAAAAVIPIYGWPLAPAEPRGVPPLTLLEPPSPLGPRT